MNTFDPLGDAPRVIIGDPKQKCAPSLSGPVSDPCTRVWEGCCQIPLDLVQCNPTYPQTLEHIEATQVSLTADCDGILAELLCAQVVLRLRSKSSLV